MLPLKWKLAKDWESSKNASCCLYVFLDTKGKPLYIGKATHFGVRYAHGYRYLVNALIASGAQLFIAALDKSQWKNVRDYEGTLINDYGKQGLNRRLVKFNPIKGLKLPTYRKSRMKTSRKGPRIS